MMSVFLSGRSLDRNTGGVSSGILSSGIVEGHTLNITFSEPVKLVIVTTLTSYSGDKNANYQLKDQYMFLPGVMRPTSAAAYISLLTPDGMQIDFQEIASSVVAIGYAAFV